MEQIFGFQEPFFHLFMSNKEAVSKIQFSFNNTAHFVTKTIECDKCKTIDNLFAEFASAFMFPEYFGINWADELLSLAQDIFKTLVKVLVNSSHEWVHGRNDDSFPTPPTPFHIVFHCPYDAEYTLLSQLRGSGISKMEVMHL